MAESKLLRVRDVARRLDITRETVLKLLASGRLRGFKAGRDWRITEEALLEFMKERPALPISELAEIDEQIAQAGGCTRSSEKDQHQRDTQRREWIPPTPYEGPGDETI